jgi:hypothetical protein
VVGFRGWGLVCVRGHFFHSILLVCVKFDGVWLLLFQKNMPMARRASRQGVAVVNSRFHPNHVPIPCLAWQGVCCRVNNSCALPPIEHRQDDISTVSDWLRI